MGSILRAQDETRESIMTRLVSKYVFGDKIQIVTNKAQQVRGVDAICNGVNIDFKFQVGNKYIGNPTDTFSLELQTDNRYGETMIGWFLDEDKITDEYGFVWITKGTAIPFVVEEIEYMQVNIAALKEALFKEISLSQIDKWCEELYGTRDRIYCSSNYRVVSSGQLFERPINLVVSKNYLKKFATKYCIVPCCD